MNTNMNSHHIFIKTLHLSIVSVDVSGGDDVIRRLASLAITVGSFGLLLVHRGLIDSCSQVTKGARQIATSSAHIGVSDDAIRARMVMRICRDTFDLLLSMIEKRTSSVSSMASMVSLSPHHDFWYDEAIASARFKTVSLDRWMMWTMLTMYPL